jgi:hypothetical protein
MATDSAIGPDLGPSPAEDGVPAFDETYKWVGAGGLQVTFGIVYERDPERGKRLNEQQDAVILEMLQWWRDAQKQIAAGTRCPGQGRHPPHCVRCQFAAEHGGGFRCAQDSAECPCARFHLDVGSDPPP